MKADHASRGRHTNHGHGRALRMTGMTPPPPIPELREGNVRCPQCGQTVRLRKDGTMFGHKTVLHRVPCILGGTKP